MSKCRKTVIIAGRFCFPDGDPASARVLGIAQALRLAGYVPLIGSARKIPREEDHQADGVYRFKGIAYEALNEGASPSLGVARKLCNYFRVGRNTACWIDQQDLSDCRAVISAGGYAHLHLRMFKYLQRQGIPYIVDCQDWFDMAHTTGAVRLLQSPNTELTMRLLNRQAGHIIAISRFFEDYYVQRACQVVRIPPLVDLTDPKWPSVGRQQSDIQKVHLVYAGSPGRKDQLAPVVRGLALACRHGVDAVLELIGLSPGELAVHLGRDASYIDVLGSRVIFRERLPTSVVPDRLSRADFSILIRPVARYSMAGFPTKVVESLAAGVPVLCNRTSDISEYIRDGVEGILLDGNSAEDVFRGLTRAASLDGSARNRMREAARRRAEECFDYHQYVEPLGKFIGQVSQRAEKRRGVA
jgi:glycosyltransferase involved in cell wall biosynthesis